MQNELFYSDVALMDGKMSKNNCLVYVSSSLIKHILALLIHLIHLEGDKIAPIKMQRVTAIVY